MAKTTSTTSPLEMDYAGIVKWAQTYLQSERDKFHVLDQPSPALLTTAYAEDVVSGNMVASIEVKQACERHLKDIK
ncbi:UNVERIFIED_CONTAM: terminase large subunit, partial [Lactobacillus helveticus]|nr:terminase large subunit [Lactobacillus helveticus]